MGALTAATPARGLGTRDMVTLTAQRPVDSRSLVCPQAQYLILAANRASENARDFSRRGLSAQASRAKVTARQLADAAMVARLNYVTHRPQSASLPGALTLARAILSNASATASLSRRPGHPR